MALFKGDGSGWAGIPGFSWIKDIKAQQANDKERKSVNAANARLAEALGAASEQYAAQRPVQSAARQEALRNVLGLYGPANEMMREMSGGKYAMDLNAPAQRFPSPYDMQLASEQQAYANRPRLMGTEQISAGGGWDSAGVEALSPAHASTYTDDYLRQLQAAGVKINPRTGKPF